MSRERRGTQPAAESDNMEDNGNGATSCDRPGTINPVSLRRRWSFFQLTKLHRLTTARRQGYPQTPSGPIIERLENSDLSGFDRQTELPDSVETAITDRTSPSDAAHQAPAQCANTPPHHPPPLAYRTPVNVIKDTRVARLVSAASIGFASLFGAISRQDPRGEGAGQCAECDGARGKAGGGLCSEKRRRGRV